MPKHQEDQTAAEDSISKQEADRKPLRTCTADVSRETLYENLTYFGERCRERMVMELLQTFRGDRAQEMSLRRDQGETTRGDRGHWPTTTRRRHSCFSKRPTNFPSSHMDPRPATGDSSFTTIRPLEELNDGHSYHGTHAAIEERNSQKTNKETKRRSISVPASRFVGSPVCRSVGAPVSRRVVSYLNDGDSGHGGLPTLQNLYLSLGIRSGRAGDTQPSTGDQGAHNLLETGDQGQLENLREEDKQTTEDTHPEEEAQGVVLVIPVISCSVAMVEPNVSSKTHTLSSMLDTDYNQSSRCLLKKTDCSR